MQGESQVWMGDVILLLLNLEFKLQKIEEKKLVHCTNLAKSLISNIKKNLHTYSIQISTKININFICLPR